MNADASFRHVLSGPACRRTARAVAVLVLLYRRQGSDAEPRHEVIVAARQVQGCEDHPGLSPHRVLHVGVVLGLQRLGQHPPWVEAERLAGAGKKSARSFARRAVGRYPPLLAWWQSVHSLSPGV